MRRSFLFCLWILAWAVEHVVLVVEPHAEYDAERQHIANQGTATVADERKRNAGDRQQLNCHAYILEDMERNHSDDTGAHIGAESIFELDCDFRQMINEHEEQNNDGACPDKAEVFRDNSEDEIGMVLRHIHLAALITFSKYFSGTDCIQGSD